MHQILEINDSDFDKIVIGNSINLPVFLKFWGNWCQPCKKMQPIFEKISMQYKSKIKIFSLNVGNNPITTGKFNIKSIPSLLIFHKKSLIKKQTGFLSEEQIKELIKDNFNI